MPDPTKKIFVKVSKSKTPPKKEEDIDGIELTPKFSVTQKKMEKNLQSSKGSKLEDTAQGINVDKSSSVAKPKIFIRKTESIGDKYTGKTIIRGEDGSKVYEGRTNMKATQDALKESAKKEKFTNEDRARNANTYNVMAGSKPELKEKDKDILVSVKSAYRVTPKKK